MTNKKESFREIGENKQGYWFEAKTYGWGWGLPLTWQGWAALGAYALAMTVASVWVSQTDNMAGFIGVTVVLTLALIAVCWLKGEPPKWRWGRKD